MQKKTRGKRRNPFQKQFSRCWRCSKSSAQQRRGEGCASVFRPNFHGNSKKQTMGGGGCKRHAERATTLPNGDAAKPDQEIRKKHRTSRSLVTIAKPDRREAPSPCRGEGGEKHIVRKRIAPWHPLNLLWVFQRKWQGGGNKEKRADGTGNRRRKPDRKYPNQGV